MFFSQRKNSQQRHTKQQLILMLLSGSTFVGLFPFIILRILANDWSNAIFNIVLGAIFLINGLYVYKTGRVQGPRLVFAVIIVAAMLIGFYLKGLAQMLWAYPALVALFFAVRPKLAATFCFICIVWISIFAYPAMLIFKFTTYITTLSFTCLFAYFFANLTRQQRKKLIKLSRRDPLTDLGNRRAFELTLNRYIGLIRDQQHTCMLLIDIDHFKEINDNFGHSVGDDVLRGLGLLMTKRIRRSDNTYRIGGEEFAIILTNSSIESAMDVAKDLGSIVENADIIEGHKITISLGIAEYCENESRDSWFKRCDDALYQAKKGGRNKFKVADGRTSTAVK